MARHETHDDGQGGNLRERFSLLSFAQKVAVGTVTAVLSAVILAGLGLGAFTVGSGSSASTVSSSGAASTLSGPAGVATTTTSSTRNTVGTTSPAPSKSSTTAQLVDSYSDVGHNTTLNASGRLTLTNVTESGIGAITGQVIWSDGLRGSGPFSGTVKGRDISFTSAIASPQECDNRCTSITYTGTVSADGTLAGIYVAYQTSGKPERGSWELTPSP